MSRMISTSALAIAVAVAASTSAGAQEAPKLAATLVGHAILPADAKIAPPADAPADLKVAGKFTGPMNRRVDAIGTLKGQTSAAHRDHPRFTGFSMPIEGQSVQGFSGIRALGGDRFLVLTDNGFGSKLNSPDAALMFHTLAVDWKTGKVVRESTTFLADPDRKVPFRIANEATDRRYLTGSDFDLESIQPVGETFWIGEEFGPYLINVDKTGKVLSVHDTVIDGKPVRSPDNHALVAPANPAAKIAFNLARSRGFEGMAVSKDGRFLYPLFEGPLWTDAGETEKEGGKEVLRIGEFDTEKKTWTGRSWKYALDINGNAIGDFNMIDATTGLIIERDNAEGSPEKLCPADKPAADCFVTVAKHKRVYKIELTDAGIARKVAYIDLMDIADPKAVARQGGKDGRFDFPFFTIENVDVVDDSHIVVGNDNNFPYSAGRKVDRADENELILLEVKALLQAK